MVLVKNIKNEIITHTFEYKSIVPMLQEVQRIFATEELENLGRDSNIEMVVRENDQSTEFHKKFYSRFHERFLSLYREFLAKEVKPLIAPKEAMVYQSRPSFRVQLPNNKAVGEFHKDSNYGHPIEEINIFLPFTNCQNTNTIRFEDGRSGDLKLGQFLVFRGGLLEHGNVENLEGQTRVSVDFRVIPMSKFKPTDASSVNTGKKFEIGDYYEVME